MAEFNKYIKHKNLDYTSCSSLPAEADSAEGEEDEPSSKRVICPKVFWQQTKIICLCLACAVSCNLSFIHIAVCFPLLRAPAVLGTTTPSPPPSCPRDTPTFAEVSATPDEGFFGVGWGHLIRAMIETFYRWLTPSIKNIKCNGLHCCEDSKCYSVPWETGGCRGLRRSEDWQIRCLHAVVIQLQEGGDETYANSSEIWLEYFVRYTG